MEIGIARDKTCSNCSWVNARNRIAGDGGRDENSFLLYVCKKNNNLFLTLVRTNVALNGPVVRDSNIVMHACAVQDSRINQNAQYRGEMSHDIGIIVPRFSLIEELIVEQRDGQTNCEEIEEIIIPRRYDVYLKEHLKGKRNRYYT